MSPKDYVARGRAEKKPVQNSSPGFPWVRAVITLLLIAGFGVFLWSIKDRSETHPVDTGSTQSEQQEALPELQEEKWDFMRELPETEVEVEVEEQELSDVPYLMQCGSFRTSEQANELKARIAFQGLESQVRASKGKNGLWYRVILGPYARKRVAETDRHTLRRADITSCKIWYWNL